MILRRLTTAGRLRAGDRGQLAHDAVDPDANVEASLLRREVDVRGADIERRRDRRVDEHDGGVSWLRSRTVAVSSVSCASLTTSTLELSMGRCTFVIAESIASGAATQMRTGIPTASRSSSENMTFVGSATATRTEPSSRKRTGSAR